MSEWAIRFKKFGKKKSKIFFSAFYIRFFYFKNEWFPLFWWAMWVNHSGRSPKMSGHERFAQFAHQKWANERINLFLERIAHSLIFLQKTSDSLVKPMSEFPALKRPYRVTTAEISGGTSRPDTGSKLFSVFDTYCTSRPHSHCGEVKSMSWPPKRRWWWYEYTHRGTVGTPLSNQRYLRNTCCIKGWGEWG